MGAQPKRKNGWRASGVLGCEGVSHSNFIHTTTPHEKEFRFTISIVYTDQVSKIHPVRDAFRFFKLMWRYNDQP